MSRVWVLVLRRRPVLLLGLLPLLLGLLPAPAQAYPGAPWFEPSRVYTQNFPDPDVLVVGSTFYAYGTATGGAYLPVMTSSDLSTWTARSAYDPGAPLNSDPYFNDALPYPASWGGTFGSGRMSKQVWAPGVERFNDRYVAFYSLRLPSTLARPERFCISSAVSSSPLGPFVDRSSAPLVCDSDPKGSIDPEPFRDPATGRVYLLWKSEGVVGSLPTRLWIRELDATGQGFVPGSVARELLRTSQGWEGNVIESPSLVRHDGQLYLFYSGNEWASSAYATSYALCAGLEGPCTKPRGTPLLASTTTRLGPGGVSAFVDTGNVLRLAYHYWNAPYTTYPAYPQCLETRSCTTQGQRRLALTALHGSGPSLQLGPPPPAPVPKSTEEACPVGRVPEDGFLDVPADSVHESAVDCVTWWRVATGNDGLYAPLAHVSRGQMASFLARMVLNSGGSLPLNPPDAFSDDDGSVHEPSINRLAAAGVVNGTAAGTYDPSSPVSRAQMATFLTRTVHHRTGERLTSTTDWFHDDAGTHEPNVNAAAGAGLVVGTGAGTYLPNAPVRRDQMASFLSRTLELFVEDGAPLPR